MTLYIPNMKHDLLKVPVEEWQAVSNTCWMLLVRRSLTTNTKWLGMLCSVASAGFSKGKSSAIIEVKTKKKVFAVEKTCFQRELIKFSPHSKWETISKSYIASHNAPQIIGIAKILMGVGPNHKPHVMRSSENFERGTFCGTMIS